MKERRVLGIEQAMKKGSDLGEGAGDGEGKKKKKK
jgi:hypothetical protein